MALQSAMYSGVSGLNTLGSSMSVIGDNIANVNTIGFKASRAHFETLLAQNVSGAAGTSQIGRGVTMSSIDAMWTQGSFETTNEATDMAIGGNGFFMVRSPTTGMYYTRAGHFQFDEDGYLVNPAGYRLQGWILDPSSPNPDGTITDIQINATSSAPNATENIDVAVNLNTASDFLESGALVESSVSTRSGFVFDDNANDTLVFSDDGVGTDFSIDMVTGLATSPLQEGVVYNGADVAQALEEALNSLGTYAGKVQTGYEVSYDQSDNTFTITNDSGGNDLVMRDSGLANDAFGLGVGSDITIADGVSTTGSEVAFVITAENNAFQISVDGEASVAVQLSTGVYTITDLRKELEEQVNLALGVTSGNERVDVRYDDSANTRNRFQILSSERGIDSAIELNAIANNFLSTISVADGANATGLESNGYSIPGYVESKDSLNSGFYFNASNDDLVVDGVTVSLVGTTVGTETFAYNTLYSGDEVAAFLSEALGADLDVTYNAVTDRFAIINNGAVAHDISWTDPDSTAAQTLGFLTATDVADETQPAGGRWDSVSGVAFNVITGVNDSLDIIVNGNPVSANNSIHVVIDAGSYTGSELAAEIESQINSFLNSEGETERVNVAYDESDEAVGGKFTIASTTLGKELSSRLISETLHMDDDTINYGQGFQVDAPDDTANYSTSLVVYDSLGNQHTVSIYFRKAHFNELDQRTTWEWFAYVPATSTASGVDEVQARGSLTFDQSGQLRSESDIEWLTTTTDSDGNTIDGAGFNFGSGAEPQQEMDLGFGMGSDVNVSTQFATPSATIFQTQDGYGSGFLQTVSVDVDGVVTGNYSNGQVLYLARVALADFTNQWGLSREGGNLYAETRNSGQPTTGTAGSAGLGQIAPNSIEQSNVDLSTEFVNMIIQQRGFQANSRVITTTDDMLGELINLKR